MCQRICDFPYNVPVAEATVIQPFQSNRYWWGPPLYVHCVEGMAPQEGMMRVEMNVADWPLKPANMNHQHISQ